MSNRRWQLDAPTAYLRFAMCALQGTSPNEPLPALWSCGRGGTGKRHRTLHPPGVVVLGVHTEVGRTVTEYSVVRRHRIIGLRIQRLAKISSDCVERCIDGFTRGIPTLAVRYDDLAARPEEVLRSILVLRVLAKHPMIRVPDFMVPGTMRS